MGRLFFLFFLLPWWAYVPASIGVLWLGERVYEQALETEAEKVAALEAAVPDPVDLGEFDRDIHPSGEVHVVGMIDHELDYELVERTNGVPDQSRHIGWLIAAAVALIGVVKRVKSVRARPVGDAEEALEQVELETVSPAPAQAFMVPEGVSEETPLGRLARRNAQGTVSAVDSEFAVARFDDPATDTVYGTHDLDADTPDVQPARALAHDSGASLAGEAQSAFLPVGEINDIPAPAQPPQSSALAFFLKLGLAMLVVGGVAYDPSLIGPALPFAAIALFWLGIYVVVGKLRSGRAQSVGGDTAPQHTRRPDGAAQPAVAGVGGHHIDLTAPVGRSRRERGVI